MSECSHDCASCKENCSSRDPKSFLVAPKETSHIKKVIGIVSGKGGVGKSLVTSLLAAGMQRRNAQSAILDADITGPSIPKSFGVNHERAMGTDEGILPVYTPGGIKVMSLNLLLDDETQPVIWRGSMISGVVTQFWSDVLWEDVDYMFVDMPPGTGDVPLTVFQSLPVDGIIVVTSPQELVSLIVTKAINMANTMNIPVLGLVENFSFVECPDCGKKSPSSAKATSTKKRKNWESMCWQKCRSIRSSPLRWTPERSNCSNRLIPTNCAMRLKRHFPNFIARKQTRIPRLFGCGTFILAIFLHNF